MRLTPDQLAAQLAERLLPIYLVSGDEPLQVGECADAIRAAARAAGHATREVLDVGPGFDWQQLGAEAAALSLFGEKKVIDLRIANGKPGSDGSRALLHYCDHPAADTLLLLTLPRLDRQQRNSKWFKAVEQHGAVVLAWPIEPRQMPAWIERRLRAAGIEADRDAVALLAERVEGNLLAARQEVEKLLLLHGPGRLDADRLTAAVTDSARYDVFELVDSALRAETARCLHILDGLRSEGVAPSIVLWALHREVRAIAALAADTARGQAPEAALRRARILPKRVALVRQGLARLRAAQWLDLLDRCVAIDRAIKGLAPHPPWLLLEDCVLAICGVRATRRLAPTIN